MTTRHTLFLLLATALFILLGVIGGAALPFDGNVVRWWSDWRTTSPMGTEILVWFTQLGGFAVLLPVLGIALAWLWWRGQRREALWLGATVLSGRLAVEGLKLLVGRARPSFDAHPVVVLSNSFPSAHAGNSMTTYLALALFAVPVEWRRQAVTGAILLALAIGATRPVLGVHWPSDVLAGWLFGLAWVSGWWWLSRRRRTAT